MGMEVAATDACVGLLRGAQDRRENVARLRRLEAQERDRLAQKQAEERRAEEEAARRREYVRQQRQEFLKEALQQRHQIQEAVNEMRITKRWRPIKLPECDGRLLPPFAVVHLSITADAWACVQHRRREHCRAQWWRQRRQRPRRSRRGSWISGDPNQVWLASTEQRGRRRGQRGTETAAATARSGGAGPARAHTVAATCAVAAARAWGDGLAVAAGAGRGSGRWRPPLSVAFAGLKGRYSRWVGLVARGMAWKSAL